MSSEYLKVKAIVEILKTKFTDVGDERAIYIAYEILEALNRLEQPEKYES